MSEEKSCKFLVTAVFIFGFALGAPAGYLVGEYNTTKQWQKETVKAGVAYFDPESGALYLGLYQKAYTMQDLADDIETNVLPKEKTHVNEKIEIKKKPDGIKLKGKAPDVVYSPAKGGVQ